MLGHVGGGLTPLAPSLQRRGGSWPHPPGPPLQRRGGEVGLTPLAPLSNGEGGTIPILCSPSPLGRGRMEMLFFHAVWLSFLIEIIVVSFIHGVIEVVFWNDFVLNDEARIFSFTF